MSDATAWLRGVVESATPGEWRVEVYEDRAMGETTCEHDFHWYPATNEDGWRCAGCGERPGEPPGFSPHLDRELLGRKVMAILHDLHDAKIVHLSNGTHADLIESHVRGRCRKAGRFDQYTVALFVLEALTPEHATYWQGVSDGVVSGSDPRKRCHCGALATSWRGGVDLCSTHAWEGDNAPF